MHALWAATCAGPHFKCPTKLRLGADRGGEWWKVNRTTVELAPIIVQWYEQPVRHIFRKFRCKHIYLDLGSNIGVQIRKLAEPDKYPNASVVPIFDRYFGSRPCDVCAIGMEPNPHHRERLAELQLELQQAGFGALMLFAAASDNDANLTLRFSKDSNRSDLEIAASTKFVDSWPSRRLKLMLQNTVQLTMPAVSVAQLISLVRRLLPRDGKLVMKLDVEGKEFDILHSLLEPAWALCQVDATFIEFHPIEYIPQAERLDACRLQNMVLGEGYSENGANRLLGMDMPSEVRRGIPSTCRTRVWALDDESYSKDGVPWPKKLDCAHNT